MNIPFGDYLKMSDVTFVMVTSTSFLTMISPSGTSTSTYNNNNNSTAITKTTKPPTTSNNKAIFTGVAPLVTTGSTLVTSVISTSSTSSINNTSSKYEFGDAAYVVGQKSNQKALAVGLGVGIPLAILLFISILVFLAWRANKTTEDDLTGSGQRRAGDGHDRGIDSDKNDAGSISSSLFDNESWQQSQFRASKEYIINYSTEDIATKYEIEPQLMVKDPLSQPQSGKIQSSPERKSRMGIIKSDVDSLVEPIGKNKKSSIMFTPRLFKLLS